MSAEDNPIAVEAITWPRKNEDGSEKVSLKQVLLGAQPAALVEFGYDNAAEQMRVIFHFSLLSVEEGVEMLEDMVKGLRAGLDAGGLDMPEGVDFNLDTGETSEHTE